MYFVVCLENLDYEVGGIVISYVFNKIIEEIELEICNLSKKVLFFIIDGWLNVGGDFFYEVIILCEILDFEIYVIGVIDSVDE